MLSNLSMYKNLVRLRKNMEKVVVNFAVFEAPKSEKKEKIDFVLTYTTSGLRGSMNQIKIEDYLQNLRDLGLSIETVQSVVYPNLMFVLVSGTKDLLRRQANIFGILLSFENAYYQKEEHRFRAFACRAVGMSVDDPEFSRAPDTFSGERPRYITDSERIMVVFQMLRTTHYGPEPTQHGILRLLEKGVFTSAYPLHDEQDDWSEFGQLSNRQILARYWADPKCFFRQQPLNLIERYFGSEVAFYFAFLKHLVFTLLCASGVGVLCFLYGLMTMETPQNIRSDQICASNITLCPACANFEICTYRELRFSCVSAHLNYILDNQAIVCYAILMSLWTTIAMELWKRTQAGLAYKWNVFSSHIDVSMRPEYAIAAQLKRKSPVTGEWEPYEDSKHKYTHIFVSYSVVILLGILAISVAVTIRFYLSFMRAVLGVSRNTLLKKYAEIIASSSASALSVIIMLVLEAFYVRLAKILTDLENPRTEVQYDNSLIYKRFILTFINGYAVTCYVAFFQGRFYTHPGREYSYHTHIQYDLCDPSGCTVNLAIHLVIVLAIKAFLMNAIQSLKPMVESWIKRMRHAKKFEKMDDLPIWEQQYNLPSLDRFFLVDEYNEIACPSWTIDYLVSFDFSESQKFKALQYGFVAFFSGAFTLAPVFALMHALISIRVDGRKFIKSFRRPVPVRVSGLMAWEGIFKMITLIGVVVNALIIGLTMDFIPRQIYEYRENKTTNFIESSLSIFNTSDYLDRQNVTHPELCYYKGKRHPPNHPAKYTLTKEYWYELAIRIGFVIIYEQVIFMVTSIVAYAIPDIPRSIKDKIEYEKTRFLKKNLGSS